MRMLAGPDAHVHFTHLSKVSSESLANAFEASGSDLSKASCYQYGVLDLIKNSPSGLDLQKVCLLDPKAERALSPEDGDGRFDWFLFGVRTLPIPDLRLLNVMTYDRES
jgi:hypothetical protein